MKLSKSYIFILILLVVCAAVLIVFNLPFIQLSEDETINKLLIDTIPRTVTGIALFVVLGLLGYRYLLKPVSKKLPAGLLWCIPCFLVILANFPFSALISGGAVLERTELIWLVLLKCISIGLMEEAFFRGLLQTIILERLRPGKYRIIIAILITSALFGLWHLLNLFYGAGIGATLMQVGYSFLIGAMLSVVLIKTENIWLCVILHALFNFGGTIVPDLGSGRFQDMWFWIFTAVAAVICAAHIVITLIKTNTCYVKLPEKDEVH